MRLVLLILAAVAVFYIWDNVGERATDEIRTHLQRPRAAKGFGAVVFLPDLTLKHLLRKMPLRIAWTLAGGRGSFAAHQGHVGDLPAAWREADARRRQGRIDVCRKG